MKCLFSGWNEPSLLLFILAYWPASWQARPHQASVENILHIPFQACLRHKNQWYGSLWGLGFFWFFLSQMRWYATKLFLGPTKNIFYWHLIWDKMPWLNVYTLWKLTQIKTNEHRRRKRARTVWWKDESHQTISTCTVCFAPDSHM